MLRIAWLLLASVVLVAPQCEKKQSDSIQITGTVRHFDLEGGFWAIRGDDNKTYDPVGGLPKEFEQEGLRVRLDAKVRSDVVSTHMVGTMVEIVKLERL